MLAPAAVDFSSLDALDGIEVLALQAAVGSVTEALRRESAEPRPLFPQSIAHLRNLHFTGRASALQDLESLFFPAPSATVACSAASSTAGGGVLSTPVVVLSAGSSSSSPHPTSAAEGGGGGPTSSVAHEGIAHAIYGMGGVGKTTMAMEYCHSAKERGLYMETDIFWVNAASQ